MSSATSIEGRDLQGDRELPPKVDLPPKGGSYKSAGGSDKSAAGSHTSASDQGFRPWHFFVLASLGASTIAVMLSRQSAPEHLILVSLTIGAAGLAAAAVYRTIVPLTIPDPSHLAERPSERARATLEREKTLVLRSIKELEFDRAMGKVSPKDFDEMAGRLRARAINLMKQLDAGGTGYREAIEQELRERLKETRRAGSLDQKGTAGSLDQKGTAGSLDEKGRAGSLDPAKKDPAPQSCTSCDTINDPDARFCKRCGSSLATA